MMWVNAGKFCQHWYKLQELINKGRKYCYTRMDYTIIHACCHCNSTLLVSQLTCACGCVGLLSTGRPSFLAPFSAVSLTGGAAFCSDAWPGIQSGNCMKKNSSLPDSLRSCSNSTREGCSCLGNSVLLWLVLAPLPQTGGLYRGGFSGPDNTMTTDTYATECLLITNSLNLFGIFIVTWSVDLSCPQPANKGSVNVMCLCLLNVYVYFRLCQGSLWTLRDCLSHMSQMYESMTWTESQQSMIWIESQQSMTWIESQQCMTWLETLTWRSRLKWAACWQACNVTLVFRRWQ